MFLCVCVCGWSNRLSVCLLCNLWLNLSDRCGLAGTDLRRYEEWEEQSSTVLREEGSKFTRFSQQKTKQQLSRTNNRQQDRGRGNVGNQEQLRWKRENTKDNASECEINWRRLFYCSSTNGFRIQMWRFRLWDVAVFLSIALYVCHIGKHSMFNCLFLCVFFLFCHRGHFVLRPAAGK